MKIDNAQFTFRDRDRGLIHVGFCFDEMGKPGQVVVKADRQLFRIDNAKGAWKPCITHAQDVVRLMLGQRPKGEFAKQRIKGTKPKLRVVSGEGHGEALSHTD